MTPDELRKIAKEYGDKMGFLKIEAEMLAAADEWERDRAASYYAGYIDGQGRIKELEQRLEVAEKACRMLAALGLENDSVGEWPEMMDAYLAAQAALAGKKK